MPFHRCLIVAALLSLATLASCAKFSARTMSAQECMTRVMYFESNRSSQEGMIAVGTVVMNRVKSGKYPGTVCGVVGQKNQFAPGVLSKPMGKGRELAEQTARMVLRGTMHPRVGKALFFHTAGYSFPYSNMHYVAIAGGNAFYEKRRNATSTQAEIMRRDSAPALPTPRAPTFDPAWTSPATRAATAIPQFAPQTLQAPPRLPALPRVEAAPARLAPMRIEDLILEGYSPG